MPTDYRKLAEENRIKYGIGRKHKIFFRQIYSDKKIHFIYELIQNADDAGSKNLAFELYNDYLLIWNDGKKFDENDVKAICSLLISTKDLSNIGTFGIGFKAVYAYTDLPEVYSGDERFRIRRIVEPELIETTPENVKALVENGKTVFRLPFKKNIGGEDLERLKNGLFSINLRNLIFLRNLEKIQIHDRLTDEYLILRRKKEKVSELAEIVEIISEDSNEKIHEKWLVVRRVVYPPKEVINKLLEELEKEYGSDDYEGELERAEYENERQRILRSANAGQPIEVAFYLNENKILPVSKSVLFSFLATQKETHLKFLIQGRYQTTPSRDNIAEDSLWNQWLVEETADFMPTVLEEVKKLGYLTPDFMDVLPIKGDEENEIGGDEIPGFFKPIVDRIYEALRNGEFIPTDDGRLSKPDCVFYPHSKEIRELLDNQDLESLTGIEGAKWIHSEIRRTEKTPNRRRYEVARKVGVKEFDADKLVSWLNTEEGLLLLKQKGESWLKRLYTYLNDQRSLFDKIRKLKIVLTETGEFVSPEEIRVFLPTEQEKDFPEIEGVCFVKRSLFEGDDAESIKSFLKNIGVKELDDHEVIVNLILPKYKADSLPPQEENIRHIRYIKKAFDSVSSEKKNRLLDLMKKSKILLVKTKNGETLYLEPEKAYISKAYTGNELLETYFTGYSTYFVDEIYLEGDRDSWLTFLKIIGCKDAPRVLQFILYDTELYKFLKDHPTLPADYERITVKLSWRELKTELEKRDLKREYSTKYQVIEDYEIEGLENALNAIESGDENALAISKSIWKLISKLIPSGRKRWDFFDGAYHWFYYQRHSKKFDNAFCKLLKESAWLPDENGIFRKPTELFLPTKENKSLLGDSVPHLHPDFKIDSELSKWFAEKIGIKLEADAESVIEYLKTLNRRKDVNFEDVKRIYEFLKNKEVFPEIFAESPLIFTPKPEPKWWKSNEVFWEDENPVFGNLRGYLKKSGYPNSLKAFFISIGVQERASILDYITAIKEIAEKGEVNEEVVIRIHSLYKRLWSEISSNSGINDEVKNALEELKNGRYWLAEKDGEVGFYRKDEIVINDHPYIYWLFKNKLPFWKFDDLVEFGQYLGIKQASNAEIKCKPIGKEYELEEWTEQLDKIIPDITRFLNSKKWKKHNPNNIGQLLPHLRNISIWKAKGILTRYSLKDVETEDPEPLQSFLDLSSRTLWVSEADDSEMPELIGSAFEEHFQIPELREFIKDLFTGERDKVLTRWRKRGLEIDVNIEELTHEIESSEFEGVVDLQETNVEEADIELSSDVGRIAESDDELFDKYEEEEIEVYSGVITEPIRRGGKYTAEKPKTSRTTSVTPKPKVSGHITTNRRPRTSQDDYSYEKHVRDSELEQKIESLRNELTKMQKFTYGWFKILNDLELAKREKDWSEKPEFDVYFKKIERYSDNLVVLTYPSFPVPFYVEDLTGLPLTVYTKEGQIDLTVDVIHVKDDKLVVKVLNKDAIPSKFDNIIEAKLSVKDLNFLLEKLKESFETDLKYNDTDCLLCELFDKDAAFIFGPPGTGKTTELAKLIIQTVFTEKNPKILILTPTNKAADVIIRKILDISDGTIKPEEVGISNPKLVEFISADFRRNIGDWVCRYGSSADKKIQDYGLVKTDFTYDSSTPLIVASTIVRLPYATCDEGMIKEMDWDYVVIDEASMVPGSYAIYTILCLGKNSKFIFAGDPFQIQPVGKTSEWRNYNIYKMFDLNEFDNPRTKHHDTGCSNSNKEFKFRVLTLETQYRSIVPIGQLFSRYKYSGRLNHKRNVVKADYTLKLSEFVFSPVTFIKFKIGKDKFNRIQRFSKGSPYNIYSALLAVELAFKLAEGFEETGFNENEDIYVRKPIGIVAPYRAQADIMSRIIGLSQYSHLIDVGTVHGFQGDENKVIIAVFNPPSENPSQNAHINNQNILNVAISRAKDYLIILAPEELLNGSQEIHRIYSVAKNIGNAFTEVNSQYIEELMFGDKNYLRNTTFITSHQSVNAYTFSSGTFKYEIRIGDDNVDVVVYEWTNPK